MIFIIILACFVGVAFSAELTCKYQLLEHSNYIYICDPEKINPLLVTYENEPISVKGNHVASFSDANVTDITFDDPNELKFVPKKLFETFKNIRNIILIKVGLSILTTNAFTNCLNMEYITLKSNKFSVIPESFAESCVKLTSFQTGQNGIQTIHKDAFKGLINLNTLDMFGELIESLDPLTFVHTPNLKHVSMNRGKLKTLQPDLFATLSLVGLTFLYNQIETVPALKFKGVQELLYFGLSGNQINSIDPELLNSYPGNKSEFLYYFGENVCVNEYQLDGKTNPSIALQPCFDNWNNLHQPSTTFGPSNPRSHKRCKYV